MSNNNLNNINLNQNIQNINVRSNSENNIYNVKQYNQYKNYNNTNISSKLSQRNLHNQSNESIGKSSRNNSSSSINSRGTNESHSRSKSTEYKYHYRKTSKVVNNEKYNPNKYHLRSKSTGQSLTSSSQRREERDNQHYKNINTTNNNGMPNNINNGNYNIGPSGSSNVNNGHKNSYSNSSRINNNKTNSKEKNVLMKNYNNYSQPQPQPHSSSQSSISSLSNANSNYYLKRDNSNHSFKNSFSQQKENIPMIQSPTSTFNNNSQNSHYIHSNSNNYSYNDDRHKISSNNNIQSSETLNSLISNGSGKSTNNYNKSSSSNYDSKTKLNRENHNGVDKYFVNDYDEEKYDDTNQNYDSSEMEDSNDEDYPQNRNVQNKNCYYKQDNLPLVERNDIKSQISNSEIERDRYGFKISYKYISRESQLLFNKSYQTILERRKSRWNLLLKENNGNIPPKITKKVKRFIRKGIPQDLRPKCWFKYSGAEDMSKNFPNLYKYLLETEIYDRKKGNLKKANKMSKSIEEIEKDLYRTFPDNEKFTTDIPTFEENAKKTDEIKEIRNPYIKALRNILVAFSYYSIDPSQGGATSDRHSKYTIGYCQSLNYVAGLLLIIFSSSKDVKFPEQSFYIEEKCFWMMVALVDEILPRELYEETQMQGAQIEQDVLWDILISENGKKYGLNGVAEWMSYMEKGIIIHNKNKYMNWESGGTMPALKSITLPWMLTCFVGVLPIETVLRVWDCLFSEGSKILIRVILTLFRIFKDDIINISDGMMAWTFIKDMPHRIINCHEFMEICFRPIIYINTYVNHLSGETEEGNEYKSSQDLDSIYEYSSTSSIKDSDSHIRSFSSPNQYQNNQSLNEVNETPKSNKKINFFNHNILPGSKSSNTNNNRIVELQKVESGSQLPRSKSDSYRMNYTKRGVGSISQKRIEKLRKIQWDKEKKKE